MQTFIEINVSDIQKRIPKGNFRRCLVTKSNFYGYGYALIAYLEKYVECIVVASISELEQVKKQNLTQEKDYIVLYEDFQNECFDNLKSNVYGVITSRKQLNDVKLLHLDRGRFYLRSDLFLGLHGIDIETCMKEIIQFKGLILHINEYLDEIEIEQLLKLDKFLSEKNVTLNIGGSIANVVVSRLHSKLEYRFAKNILFDSLGAKSNFCLHLQIINEEKAKRTIIGYKSCQKTISAGWIYLVAIGYGDWTLLPRIYESDVKLVYQNNSLSIPVYPCMNTCWLHSAKQLTCANNMLVLFENKEDILDLCEKLDIDTDEFTSSFSYNLKREYYQ